MLIVILILVVLGLSLGSFINALVWRLHQPKLSVFKGRSICPHCRHELVAKDLVPVFSWLWLKGRCRYCHKGISKQYPLVELLTAGLFIFSYLSWPEAFSLTQSILFGLWLLFVTGLVAMALYDLKWHILPNSLTYPLLTLAVAQTVWLAAAGQTWAVLGGAFWGVLVGGGIFYLMFQVSGGKWIGGGDVKLGALLGLLVGGPVQSLLVIFTASALGSVISIPLLVSGRYKRGTHLPFGPFLIAAVIIVRLFGTALVAWYKRQVLF